MFDITASIVAFRNDEEVLLKAIESFSNCGLAVYLYIIDNSPTDVLRKICERRNVEYIFNKKNLGFGAGHNIAIDKMIGRTKYSLILNPDVYFDQGTIEKLFRFMENQKDVGLIMPKVLYPDGRIQYLCRLLPSPCDLLLRKIEIKALSLLFNSRKSRYELKFADYNQQMDVPYLSGCFMFIRTETFKKVGVFDERFFIYLEDVDLSRRINKVYRNVYFPEAAVYHGYERGSNKYFKLFIELAVSGIRYFNKWGWFFDQDRKLINSTALSRLKKKGNDSATSPAQ